MFSLKRLVNYLHFSQHPPLTVRLLNRRIHCQSALQKEKKTDSLSVEIGGEKWEFPNVWLRDNCQCGRCYHPTAKSRTIDWSAFNVDVAPKDVATTGTSLRVTWDDGHTSEYTFHWLKLRGFTEPCQRKYTETIYKPPKVTWSGEHFNDIFSKHNYNEILASKEALYNWLYQLSVHGVALVQSAPHCDTAVDRLVEKIGFLKQTHYGEKFIVQHVAGTSNVAYLSSNLQMHTDLPYYEYCPGVNLLHCLVQTRSGGGGNLLTDCHHVAQHMKAHHPHQYQLLTDTQVEWSDIGTEHGNAFFKLHRAPVICLDQEGEITRINFSIPQRGTHFPGPIELVKRWYEAHGLFYKLNLKYAASFKTKPGDILCFDNRRLLHGRSAYEDNQDNVRKVIGVYVDWDEIYSRLRCLKIHMEPTEQ